MLYIFQGPSPLNLIAGDIQSAIESQIGECEHSSTVQERQDGRYDLLTRLETLTEVHQRLAVENGVGIPVIQDMLTRNVDNLDSSPQPIIIGEIRRSQPRRIRISSNLVKDDGSLITLDDFPKSFSFGNGVTCNSTVRLKDGSIRVLSWAILHPSTADLVESNAALYSTLRQLIEG